MVKLRHILKRKQAVGLLQDIADSFAAPISVFDAKGKLVFGPSGNQGVEAPLVVNGEHLGSVKSDVTAAAVSASVLSAYISQEIEKVMLSEDTLGKYNELAVLYEVSPRLIELREPRELARQVLDWAMSMIEASSGVLVQEKKHGIFEVLACRGDEKLARSCLGGVHSLLVNSVRQGKSEIVNNAMEDYRVTTDKANGEGGKPVLSGLLCAPILDLGGAESVSGAVLLFHSRAQEYTARDIKLLQCLACQTGMALQNNRRGRKLCL